MKKNNSKTALHKRNQRDMAFNVLSPNTLLLFMQEVMPDKSRTTLKQLLYTGQVSVNGKRCTQFDEPLEPGFKVGVHANRLPEELHHPLITILWQDTDFLVLEKKPGIPTVATVKEKERTVLRIVSDHLKKFDPGVKVFMLNRLDKDAAGLLLFAKNKKAQEYVIENWHEVVLEQRFLAVIEGRMPQREGMLQAPKLDEPANRDRASSKQDFELRGNTGRASYKVLREGAVCSMLEFKLHEGRNNQLRRQFKELQLPIAGDWRNGSSFKQLKQMALFASFLLFKHPLTGEKQVFKLPTPKLFGQLVRYTESYNPLPKELKGDGKPTKKNKNTQY